MGDQQRDYFHSLFSLTGKNCIVTGAASGLGRQCALVFAKAGANIGLVDIDNDGLLETKKQIDRYSGTVFKQQLDLRDSKQVFQAVKEMGKELSTFDVLVNCAGVVIFKPVFEQTEKDWDSVFDTDIKGMWLLSKEISQYMIKAKIKGSIINISSAVSCRPQKNLTPYGACKAAVNHFTKSFANDMLPYGIRVNCLAPGGMLTEMVKEFLKTKDGANAINSVPLKRFATLNELDACLLFMASNAASGYMTGSVVHLDGGLCIAPLET
ncbi:MAG: SDR family oxidoreductase [Desulfobacteraceae bacterium]|nr:SDR family oxidoreductase [Desulfobacteraceae bacterium]